jgi:hypothetical protein
MSILCSGDGTPATQSKDNKPWSICLTYMIGEPYATSTSGHLNLMKLSAGQP